MSTSDNRRATDRGRQSQQPTTIHRRRAIGLGAGGLLTLAGCGGSDGAEPTPLTLTPAATPVVALPGFDDPRRWTGRTLRVGGWGSEVQVALREAVWQPFATATGCTIQEVATDYRQLERSVATGASYADVLIVDAIWAASAAANGLVETIPGDAVDRSKLGPVTASDAAVPAYCYALVDGFRRDAVEQVGEPEDWRDWWDIDRFAGGRALPRQALGTFEFALMADGVAASELYPLDGTRAIERLQQIGGQIADRWWETGEQPVSWLSQKQADFAAAWHHRIVAAQQDGRPIDFIWNQGLLIADYWVTPARALAGDVAFDLIRYATTPDVQAALARRIPLGPVRQEALDLLDGRVATNLPTAREHAERLVPLNAEWWAENGVVANEQFNDWLLGAPAND